MDDAVVAPKVSEVVDDLDQELVTASFQRERDEVLIG